MEKDNIRYYLLSMVGLLVMCGCSESEMDYDYIPALKEYYLSIAPTSHSVPSAGSTSNFSIKAGSNRWDISNPAFWLELDNKSGIGSSTIGFKTSDNLSSDTARVSILTIDSEEGDWHRSIPVTISQQKASPYINIGAYEQTIPGKASSVKISIDANMVWTASSDASWATVAASKDGKYIDLDFTENTGISRKATITIKGNISKSITIVQQSANITASLQSLFFGQSGGTQTVQVSAEASWEARSSANWLGLNPSTGHAGVTNLYITATANNSLNDRADFVYVCIGDNYQEIRVDQPGAYLNISATSLSFVASGESQSVSVSSNTSWDVVSCPDWISLNTKSGTDNAELILTAQSNESVNSREGKITIENSVKNISRTITLLQPGKTFDLGTQELTFSDKAGSQSIEIQTDLQWTASTGAEWITLNPSSGKGKSKLQISVTENTDTLDRIGYVSVYAGGKTLSIAVVQESKYIHISSEAFHFDASTGNSTLSISTNYNWNAHVEDGANWLIVMPKSGSGDANITIGVSENNTLKQRTAKVYIETENAKTYIVEVTQDGRYLTADHTEVNFSQKGGTETVTVSTNAPFTVSKDGSWISITCQDNLITVNIGENTSDLARRGCITLTMDGTSSDQFELIIPVTQEGKPFDVETKALDFSDKSGQQSIELVTDLSWMASTSDKWITVSPSTGLGKGVLNVSVIENTDTLDRTGHVNVTAGGKTIVITINQKSKYFRLSSTSLHFGVNTDNAPISIETNYNWTAYVESGVNWAIVMPKSGSGDGTLTVGVSENNTPSRRTAKIYIDAQDAKTYVIDVTQDGRYLKTDKTEVNFSKSGGTETITVSTDAEFTISKTGTWFGYTRQDNTIKILAGENATGAARTGSITLTMTGISSGSYVLEILVRQNEK